MEDAWTQLETLEKRIREHNSHIEQISPIKFLSSSPISECLMPEIGLLRSHKPQDGRLLGRSSFLAKDIKDWEQQSGLQQRELASLGHYQEQCKNLKAQIQLYLEKLRYYEEQLQDKNRIIKDLERSSKPRGEPSETKAGKARAGKTIEQLKQDLWEREARLNETIQSNQTLKADNERLAESIKRDQQAASHSLQRLAELKAKFQAEQQELTKKLNDLRLNNDASERENGRLRTELERAVASLKLCQEQLEVLPQIHGEVVKLRYDSKVKTT
jgi:hypothetical protein